MPAEDEPQLDDTAVTRGMNGGVPTALVVFVGPALFLALIAAIVVILGPLVGSCSSSDGDVGWIDIAFDGMPFFDPTPNVSECSS